MYLTQDILTKAKNNIVIMHPLPRNEELNIDIDNDQEQHTLDRWKMDYILEWLYYKIF